MLVVLTCVDHGRRLFSEQSGHVPVTGFESCAHTGSPAPASASEPDSSSDSDCSESSFCDHMEHTRTCNAALASVVLPAAVAVHS